ncbi:hypothetical protein RSOLAG22IIIB_12566 [Rhizoctonia solani]|uniref:Uncharacterized protein n=1 Tax=Rhizoctonia solani TaxID=456999 RepID=A0A0K6GFA1_9AGAM|nr:unnamed protein product [Rhizoctonia solani]CUA77146.1 hypothetical protein RSOLAG22IIIB_12566 [Rhizoctonia solani]
MFTHKDSKLDRNLMQLALRVVGQRMTGRQEEPRNIARRVVAVGEMSFNVLVTRLAQSIIEPGTGEPGPTRQDELVQFLTLLHIPDTGSRQVSTSSAQLSRSKTGHTLSHLCAMVGFDDLVSCGADPDVRDETGQMPLHSAALRGRAACVRALLQAGMDAEIANVYGTVLVNIAREHTRLEVLALLEGVDEAEAVKEDGEIKLTNPRPRRPSVPGAMYVEHPV